MSAHTPDLAREAIAYSKAVKRVHLERLMQLGVPYAQIGTLGQNQFQIGFTRTRWHKSGHWEPAEDGIPSLVIPVCKVKYFEVFDFNVDHCEVVDLIAVRTDSPNRWAWRRGISWAMGEELLTEHTGDPIDVVSTPIDWLAKGGTACCILDWSQRSPAWQALRSGPPLHCDSELLSRKLRDGMRSTISLPDMEVNRAA